MADAYLRNVIRTLQRLAPQGTDQPSDGHYLDRFVRQRDEAAFEVLIWRHGQRVWNVCRRVLTREADVEDAFQATFLTLVRKAGTISNGESLGSWLHKVALRNALASRATAARCALTTGDDFAWHAERQPEERGWSEARPLLADEVNQLPPKYRLPVELCYLQGKTLNEAARDLGCGKGTLGSRLARARKRLRGRLTRRGAFASVNRQKTSDTLEYKHHDHLRGPQEVAVGLTAPSPPAVQIAVTASESTGGSPHVGWLPPTCHTGPTPAEPRPLLVDTASFVEIDSTALRTLATDMQASPIVAVSGPAVPPGRQIVTAWMETAEQCIVGIDWTRYPGIYRATTADIDSNVARLVRDGGGKPSGRCAWCAARMEVPVLRENRSHGICGRCQDKVLAVLRRRGGCDLATSRWALIMPARRSVQRPLLLSPPWLGSGRAGDSGPLPLQCRDGMSGVLLGPGRGWFGKS
jgi:RNA polymerase sigma factor (sigma-70 family)